MGFAHFFLLQFFLFGNFVHAEVEDVGFVRRVYGWMGNEGKCDNSSILELNIINQECSTKKSSLLKTTEAIDASIEEVFFQDLAKRSHAATICQKEFTHHFLTDAASKEKLTLLSLILRCRAGVACLT